MNGRGKAFRGAAASVPADAAAVSGPGTGAPGTHVKRVYKTDAAHMKKSLAVAVGDRKPQSRHFARLVLILLLAACGAALQSRGGAVEWLLFATAAAMAVWCIVIPYAAVGRITVERSIDAGARLVDGGSMIVRLTVRSTRPLPMMWVSVKEEIINASEAEGSRPSPPLLFRAIALSLFSRKQTISYTVMGLQRGELLFRPVRITVGDLLGMSMRSFIISTDGRALVRPVPPQGDRIEGLPGSLARTKPVHKRPIDSIGASSMSAAAAVRRSGSGVQSRVYVPGDPLWRVNWRAMARGLGLHTRISDAELPGDTVILLDASKTVYTGDGRLFDANAGRAWLAVRSAWEAGNGIKLICTDLEETRIHIRSGDRSALRNAEERLARLRADGVKPLAEWLADITASLPRGAAFVCFSAVHSDLPDGAAVMGGAARKPGDLTGASRARGGNSSLAAAEAGNKIYGSSLEDSPAGHMSSIYHAARIAGVRGARLYMLFSCRGAVPSDAERRWQERLSGAGCFAGLLPVPADYRKQPEIAEGVDRDASAAIS
ncbi:DUF58 domain-containing protein [Paenibacillus sp. sptzw28]|uniref:DUF58 domain-containing protein n=1 Tax=Paenibacillus sp. sptzw28 TaxID=715179 RepID=UPI002163454B|nr:DUF58 domain-containing protein [Paenibacillus sp. sptzw28]